MQFNTGYIPKDLKMSIMSKKSKAVDCEDYRIIGFSYN